MNLAERLSWNKMKRPALPCRHAGAENFGLDPTAKISQNRVMRTLGLILLIGTMLAWQVTARAGNAVLLKAHSYQVVRDGYPMPKRILSVGTIVKVLATHGTKADIATSGGDKVSVRLADLRMLHDPGVTSSDFPITNQPLVVATPPPIVPWPPQSPLPNQAGGTREKVSDPGPVHPGETGRRPAAVRCRHVLKNGAQCSRMTTSPNGLCWQHGGD